MSRSFCSSWAARRSACESQLISDRPAHPSCRLTHSGCEGKGHSAETTTTTTTTTFDPGPRSSAAAMSAASTWFAHLAEREMPPLHHFRSRLLYATGVSSHHQTCKHANMQTTTLLSLPRETGDLIPLRPTANHDTPPISSSFSR